MPGRADMHPDVQLGSTEVNAPLAIPGITSGAYSADQYLGTGPIQISGVVRNTGSGLGFVVLIIEPASQQKAPIDVIFFDRSPAVYANKTASSIGVSDAANIIGGGSIAATDYFNLGSAGAVAIKQIPPFPVFPDDNQSIWLVLKVGSGGTPNYTGQAPQVIFKLGYLQD